MITNYSYGLKQKNFDKKNVIINDNKSEMCIQCLKNKKYKD